MNREAIYHCNTENDIYPIQRNQLVVRIRTAKKDIKKCEMIFFNRTDPDDKTVQLMKIEQRDGLFDYFQTKIIFTKVARYQKYYFSLEDYDGQKQFYGANGLRETKPDTDCFEFLYANQNDVQIPPDWAQGLVFYQIFPERFCNGEMYNDPGNCEPWGTMPTRENFMGGDLKGIQQKIPYLQELGVEGIYLNPIFKADFNHKYATTDYYEVDPIFGTNADFKDLVVELHKANIKILLDGVFNHVGIHFAPFEDVCRNEDKSKYKDWFLINSYPVDISHHNYECVGAYKYMPRLNTSNSEVRNFIIGVMNFWIEEYDIDGWRLDVADEVDATVWQFARTSLRDKYPNILLLGETWGYGGKLIQGHQMDSVMNYMFRDAVRDYIAWNKITTKEFDYRINKMLAGYHMETNQAMYNLLDSHDTERFLWLCKENIEKLKIATAFQMTFVGAPAIYYGDEQGMTGDNDPDCRRCMVWDSGNLEVYNFYKKLIALRKKYDCIRRGDYHTNIADDEKKVFGFIRTLENERVYVIIHNDNDTQKIQVPVIEKYSEFIDLLDNKKYQMVDTKQAFYNEDISEYGGMIEVEMTPYSVKVITTLKEENKNEKR